MPFLCAVPPNLPIDPKGVNTPPGAGPVLRLEQEEGHPDRAPQEPVLRRHPKQNWDVIRVTVEMGEQASYLQVRKGEADLDLYSLPTAAHTQLTKEFGINKGRYFVHPVELDRLLRAQHVARDLQGREGAPAVAYAVDRPGLTRPRRPQRRNAERADPAARDPGLPRREHLPARQAEHREGEGAARRQDREGRDVHDERPARDQHRAARAGEPEGDRPRRRGQALHVRRPRSTRRERAATRSTSLSIGWFADYPDPYDFINILLDGRNDRAEEQRQPVVLQRRRRTSGRWTPRRGSAGDARYRAYGNLDIDITRNQSPLVITNNQNVREFISSKVGCANYSFAWGGLNIAMLCPKG